MKYFILKNRAMVKTVTWRIVASFITIAIIFALTRNILVAISIVGIEFFTKMFLYWAHEKGWSFSNKPPKGSRVRAIAKTVTWRIVASLDTLVFVMLVTGEALYASSAAIIETVVKTFAYYLHERIWNLNFQENVMLDLHIHSTCSDGTMTPAEIFELAAQKQCKYISITDHDNFDHVALVKDIPKGMKYIPGVEISAELSTALHILGYGFDPEHPELRSTLQSLQLARRTRNEAMLKNMENQGFHISYEELITESQGGIVGRPHFANLMLKKGYVSTYQEAFDKYLAKGQPLYMDKQRLEPKAAIQLIHAAGGIPVMAHPYQCGLELDALEALILELKSYGLMGIEAYYSQHSKVQTRHYVHLARKHDLLITAGSDFHGGNRPHIELGMFVKKIHLYPFLEAIEK